MFISLEQNRDPYKKILQVGLLYAATTLAVLYLFQPFGTYESDISYKYLKLFGYGLVTFCAFVLIGLVELSLINKKRLLTHRVWLMPLLYIVCAAVFNHGYFAVTVLGAWHWQNQLLFVFYVLAMASFPTLFIYVVNRHAKQYAQVNVKRAAEVTALSADEPTTHVLDNTPALQQHTEVVFTLVGENKNEHLSLSLSQLVCIKAADNYCEIIHLEQQQQQTALLRISLNKLLEQIPEEYEIHRCHRSYAVNLEQVVNYTGNSAGLNLNTSIPDLQIPVSRAFVKDIKAALSVI